MLLSLFLVRIFPLINSLLLLAYSKHSRQKLFISLLIAPFVLGACQGDSQKSSANREDLEFYASMSAQFYCRARAVDVPPKKASVAAAATIANLIIKKHGGVMEGKLRTEQEIRVFALNNVNLGAFQFCPNLMPDADRVSAQNLFNQTKNNSNK